MLDNKRMTATEEFSLPQHSAYFDGHFDHKKILPAVAQISLCMDLHKEKFNQDFLVKSARFYREIAPDQSISIRCNHGSDSKLVFEILHQNELCSKITFSLAQ